MNRKEIEEYIFNTYGIKPDYPWAKYPSFAVFRHKNNKKWFAVVMTIKREKLGLKGQEKVDVVNLKRDVFNLSLIDSKGVFPAYHMNKEHWITALLDGEVKKEDLKLLIELSYSLTI